MTPEGVVEKNEIHRTVYEFGNTELIRIISEDILDLLKKHFPDSWNDIYALAVTRLPDPVPMRSAKERLDKLYLSRDIDSHISLDSISSLLRDIGIDRYAQDSLLSDIMRKSRKVSFDLSGILSRSESISLTAKGHNHEHFYLKQISMALIFYIYSYRPVCLTIYNNDFTLVPLVCYQVPFSVQVY